MEYCNFISIGGKLFEDPQNCAVVDGLYNIAINLHDNYVVEQVGKEVEQLWERLDKKFAKVSEVGNSTVKLEIALQRIRLITSEVAELKAMEGVHPGGDWRSVMEKIREVVERSEKEQYKIIAKMKCDSGRGGASLSRSCSMSTDSLLPTTSFGPGTPAVTTTIISPSTTVFTPKEVVDDPLQEVFYQLVTSTNTTLSSSMVRHLECSFSFSGGSKPPIMRTSNLQAANYIQPANCQPYVFSSTTPGDTDHLQTQRSGDNLHGPPPGLGTRFPGQCLNLGTSLHLSVQSQPLHLGTSFHSLVPSHHMDLGASLQIKIQDQSPGLEESFIRQPSGLEASFPCQPSGVRTRCLKPSSGLGTTFTFSSHVPSLSPCPTLPTPEAMYSKPPHTSHPKEKDQPDSTEEDLVEMWKSWCLVERPLSESASSEVEYVEVLSSLRSWHTQENPGPLLNDLKSTKQWSPRRMWHPGEHPQFSSSSYPDSKEVMPETVWSIWGLVKHPQFNYSEPDSRKVLSLWSIWDPGGHPDFISREPTSSEVMSARRIWDPGGDPLYIRRLQEHSVRFRAEILWEFICP